MKRFLLVFISAGFLFSCKQAREMPITELSSDELENAVVIDVRTPEEYEEGHLEGALNLNWYDASFVQQLEGIDKDQKVYVYCKVGGRSASAAKLLDSLGYKEVVDLTGGYDAWLKARD